MYRDAVSLVEIPRVQTHFAFCRHLSRTRSHVAALRLLLVHDDLNHGRQRFTYFGEERVVDFPGTK